MWPREKESNLQFRVQSPTCCQLHHPGRDVEMQLPLTHPHRSIDQHAVVTLHPTLYACDFAGSYSLSGVEPVTRPLASPKLRQAQFPTYPVGYGLCSPLSCRLPAASISQLTQFASSVPECACRVRDTALLIRQRASESRRR